MIVNTVRWLVLDTFHHWTGLCQGDWDFSQLQCNVAAYDVLGENHYRFYQFHGGMAIAVPFWYAARWIGSGFWAAPLGWGVFGIVALELLLLAGSRDNLRKYYDRMSMLLCGGAHSLPRQR